MWFNTEDGHIGQAWTAGYEVRFAYCLAYAVKCIYILNRDYIILLPSLAPILKGPVPGEPCSDHQLARAHNECYTEKKTKLDFGGKTGPGVMTLGMSKAKWKKDRRKINEQKIWIRKVRGKEAQTGRAGQRLGKKGQRGPCRALCQHKAQLHDGQGLYSILLFSCLQTLLLFTL